MPNNLYYDNLAHTQKVYDYGFEQAIEQEILLADYDQPVFKIVKTCLEHTMTQKYTSGSKLILEGYFKLSVYYQPPNSEKLSITTHKIPFQKQLDLPQAVSTPNFIVINGETQYINTRAQNPTRIDVRGAYQFTVKVYAPQEIQIVTALNSPTVCTDDTEVDFFNLVGQGVRQFSVEDEITMPEDTLQILNAVLHNKDMVITTYQDKVNIKGEIIADLWHTSTEADTINKYSKTFLYNQVIDIPDITENNITYADLIPVSFTVSQNPETKKIMALVTAQLDAKVFRKQQVICINDAFSKAYEYQAKNKTITYDENLASLNKNLTLIMQDSIDKDYTVAHTFVEVGGVRSYFEIDKTTLKAKVTAHIIVKNAQNEYECLTNTEDYIVEVLENSTANDEITATINLEQSTTTLNEDNLTLKINLSLDGFAIKRKQITILDEFEELTEEAMTKAQQALVLYYAQKGENVFDIARRYRTSTQSIINENNLEAKTVTEDKMLFIPAFDV